MKTRLRLVILRHGESGWDGDPPSDHERTLTTEGVAQARAAGLALRDRGWMPQRIVSSSARRAAETATLVCEALGLPPGLLSLHGDMYLGGLGVLQACVGALPADVDTVVVVGHNPALSAASSMLCGGALSLSPGWAALLEQTAGAWDEALQPGRWQLVELLTANS